MSAAGERIAELEQRVDEILRMLNVKEPAPIVQEMQAVFLIAIVLELRAMRLTIREELREAAWRLSPKENY